jgi:biotin synthase-like enzyme
VCRTACAQEMQEVPEAVQEVVQEQEVQVCWCAGVYS